MKMAMMERKEGNELMANSLHLGNSLESQMANILVDLCLQKIILNIVSTSQID